MLKNMTAGALILVLGLSTCTENEQDQPKPPDPKANIDGVKKAPMHLADLKYLTAMCNSFEDGLRGDRAANGWKDLKWTIATEAEYIAKVLRHLHAYSCADTEQEKRIHAAAIGCNGNILWHHAREEKTDE